MPLLFEREAQLKMGGVEVGVEVHRLGELGDGVVELVGLAQRDRVVGEHIGRVEAGRGLEMRQGFGELAMFDQVGRPVVVQVGRFGVVFEHVCVERRCGLPTREVVAGGGDRREGGRADGHHGEAAPPRSPAGAWVAQPVGEQCGQRQGRVR